MKKLETSKEVMALLKKHGVLTLTRTHDDVPSLVGSIAGDVRGSWWGHPKGNLVFNIATELEERPDVLVAKLVRGKVTFVHSALFAPLYRVVSDPTFVESALALVSPGARRLHARVEREGTINEAELLGDAGADAKRAHKKQRDELEKRALLQSFSEHTPSGHHVTVLRAWRAWASDATKREGAKLDPSKARARLAAHGIAL